MQLVSRARLRSDLEKVRVFNCLDGVCLIAKPDHRLMATRPPRTPTPTSPSNVRSSAAAVGAPFLSSLYIYNPSLGTTDAAVHEQLIWTFPAKPPPSTKNADDAAAGEAAELDRQLRAIGLAQGIVQFARAFSPDAPLREVRTQKGFAVPLEVERGWWMLAVPPPPWDKS